MAGVRGARDTLTDTTVQRRQVEDQIVNFSPKAVPFLKRIGFNGETVSNPKYEWHEDELFALTAAVHGSTVMTDGAHTTVTLAANDAYNFRVGDILLVEDEQIRVTAIASDNSLTITRGWGSTSGASHAAGTTISRISQAYAENTDSVVAGTTTHSFPFNYAQIIDVAYQVSHRAQNTGEYGLSDRLDYEAEKVLTDAFSMLERAALYGAERVLRTSSVPGAFGGLKTFITDNTDSTSEAITEKKINNLLALIFADVGHETMATWIVTGQWQKRKISDFYRPLARMDRGSREGGIVVDVIDTDFGEIDVSMVFNCPTDHAYFLNPSLIDYHSFKNSAFFTEPLPEDGAYFKEHLYGDYTMSCRWDKAHGYMSNLSTS